MTDPPQPLPQVSRYALNSSPAVRGKIDPANIFVQADGFYKAYAALMSDENISNPELMSAIGQSAIVLVSFSTELFLKCLVCIETGKALRGHHLKNLYDQLSAPTRKRIEFFWETELVPYYGATWAAYEAASGRKVARDLPTALLVGSQTFERIRYAYEDDSDRSAFNLSGLPRDLRRVVLELKPEWSKLRREAQTFAPPKARPGYTQHAFCFAIPRGRRGRCRSPDKRDRGFAGAAQAPGFAALTRATLAVRL